MRRKILVDHLGAEAGRRVLDRAQAWEAMATLTRFACAFISYWLIAVAAFQPYGEYSWGIFILIDLIFAVLPLALGLWLIKAFIVRHYLYRLTSALTDTLVELTRLQWLCRAEVTTSRRARRYYLRIEKSRRRLTRSIGYYGLVLSRLRGMAADDTESVSWYFSRWISWVAQDCLEPYRLSEVSKVAVALLEHTTTRRPYLPLPLSEPPWEARLAEVPKWQWAAKLVGAVASPLGLSLIALVAAALTATAKLI